MSYASVEFESEGATLRGRLYVPEGMPPFPAIVMAHGTSATITMCADRYAERFAESGIAALLYDHRNFGLSDGEPRQQINPWLQARGYISALDFLSSHRLVDPARLGLWGDSFTGGVPDLDGERFSRIRSTLLDGDISGTLETTVGPLPVVSPDQLGTPSLLKPVSAFRWFVEYGGRHGSHWQNVASRVSPAVPEPYHPGICAPHVRVPTLALISPSDEMEGANPQVARSVFESVGGPVEILEIEGGHFGLLFYPSPEFEFAATEQARFLERTLQDKSP